MAEALGYSNSRKALSDHVDEEDKGVMLHVRENCAILRSSHVIKFRHLWRNIYCKLFHPRKHIFKSMRIENGRTFGRSLVMYTKGIRNVYTLYKVNDCRLKITFEM